MKALALAFDMGTQSGRAILVDTKGNIVDKVQKKYEKPYISKEPGWAEQDPEFYWQVICECSLELKERNLEIWNDIIAVSITTIRNTVVCVDKEGKAVRNAILWCDQRESKNHPTLPIAKLAAFKVIGMLDTVQLQMKSASCNWIKYHRPKDWAKTYKFLHISTYLIHKFVGVYKDSNASLTGHVPYNSKERRWQGENELTRCLFDIEPEKLCEVVKPGTILGTINEEVSRKTGIPQGVEFVVTGADKGCETLGLSCNTSDKAAISFGTTATIQVTLDRYLEPIPFIPPYPAVIDGRYSSEIYITRGYWLISWFKKEFAEKEMEQAKTKGCSPEELLNIRLTEIPPGCEGLVFQPFFSPGIDTPTARGAIVGFNSSHTRIHIYRAIIEGINFALLEGLRVIERRGKFKVKELYMAGGGSQSDEICQITANMFGLPAHRIQTHEVCGLGSAMTSFVAKGIFKDLDEAAEHMSQIKDTFEPDMEEHRIYEKLFKEVFSAIFPRLLPIYKKADIYHNEALELEDEEK
ncbi:FGGY-family carbohydrate kinase [Clostridium sp. CS001]|uniref:FGGY-family carbohydrate kinase n=1 Tax=Clostridium sp. CS001 TaxID=2880648 RepID=UPI001CF1FB17|nr:FGGY-family carbohydrate kinase [Clostridium sp. CS001]MCB2289845.1 FGGY-family carbohydrate kinase [Clostridium sp. CS001]